MATRIEKKIISYGVRKDEPQETVKAAAAANEPKPAEIGRAHV